jgi:hypothetical protein
MPGPNLARAQAAVAPGITEIPRGVKALLAKYGLTLAVGDRVREDHPVLRLVDATTGVPVHRLPGDLATAINRMVVRRSVTRRRKENPR